MEGSGAMLPNAFDIQNQKKRFWYLCKHGAHDVRKFDCEEAEFDKHNASFPGFFCDYPIKGGGYYDVLSDGTEKWVQSSMMHPDLTYSGNGWWYAYFTNDSSKIVSPAEVKPLSSNAKRSVALKIFTKVVSLRGRLIKRTTRACAFSLKLLCHQ